MVAIERPHERLHPDLWLAPAEVAELFDVTTKTVGRWADRGILVSRRTNGGHRRIRAGSAYALLDALRDLEGVGVP